MALPRDGSPGARRLGFDAIRMSTSTLTFQTTTPAMLISVIVVLVTAFLCQAAWRRSGCLRSVGLLEGLRFCLVLSVAVLLNQPEWIEEIRPPDRPTVVVLWDDSGSMATRDVLNDERPGNPPVRRSEWVQPLLDADLWQAASDRVKIVFEPFSSSEGSPDGTDINTALKSVPEKHLNLRAVVLLSDGDWNEGGGARSRSDETASERSPGLWRRGWQRDCFAGHPDRQSRCADIRCRRQGRADPVHNPQFAVARLSRRRDSRIQ